MLHKPVYPWFIAPALLLSIAFAITPPTASSEAADDGELWITSQGTSTEYIVNFMGERLAQFSFPAGGISANRLDGCGRFHLRTVGKRASWSPPPCWQRVLRHRLLTVSSACGSILCRRQPSPRLSSPCFRVTRPPLRTREPAMRHAVPSYKASGPSDSRAPSPDCLTSAWGGICRGFGAMASTACWIDAPCRLGAGRRLSQPRCLSLSSSRWSA